MQRRSLLTALGLSAVDPPRPARAQAAFPDRPVRIVVPFPPGGSYDVVARLLSRPLQEAWPRGVVIDNRPGAGGNIGADAVAKAVPDGHTLLLWGDGLLINQALYQHRPWEALRDFAAVAKLAQSPQILVTVPGRGPTSLPALLGFSQDHEITCATAGIGSTGHLAAALLRARTGAKLVHVPYRGSAPALNDLLAGQVDLVCTGIPACLPFLLDGKLAALGVSSAGRFTALPTAPAIAETVPGFAMDCWYGLLAPAGTAPALRARIADAALGALSKQATAAALRAQGYKPDPMEPAPFTDLLGRDAVRWGELVALSGARMD